MSIPVTIIVTEPIVASSNHFNGKIRVERSRNSINIPIKLPSIDKWNTPSTYQLN